MTSQSVSEVPQSSVLEEAVARAGEGPDGGIVSHYFGFVGGDDLVDRDPQDLLGMVRAHRELAAARRPGEPALQVISPTDETDGWDVPGTALQIVTDDMPFLVDSVTAEMSRQGLQVTLVVHPQFLVARDGEALVSVEPLTVASEPGGALPESWMHLEFVGSLDDGQRAELVAGVEQVLRDVRVAVDDWAQMRETALAIAGGLDPVALERAGVAAADVDRARSLLGWLADDHFTFLGYGEYSLQDGMLAPVRGTGLGILRAASADTLEEPRRAVRTTSGPRLLTVTKDNSRSTVHRPVPLDHISVHTYDDQGRPTGERRILGLFTSSAYTESVLRVPALREKVDAIVRASGFSPQSHSAKDLVEVLETYPRDELLQASVAELIPTVMQVVLLKERRRAGLFVRHDEFGRFVSVLVYIPRDRYTTSVRLRMVEVLQEAYGARDIDFAALVGESDLARLHFVVRMPQGEEIPEVDAAALEQEMLNATRTWDEDLADRAHAEDQGLAPRAMAQFAQRFPEAYKEDFGADAAIADLRHLAGLGDQDTALRLYRDGDQDDAVRRLKVYRAGAMTLTEILPIFTHLGLEVVDERPYEIQRTDGRAVRIYDFGLRAPQASWWTGEHVGLDEQTVADRFEAAFAAVWGGQAESDTLSALVLGAGLQWRQVVILRLIARYLRQTGSTFSLEYIEGALTSNVDIAGRIVELFEVRFDPSRGGDLDSRGAEARRVEGEIDRMLESVSSLDHDRIIRAFVDVIRAALRTSFYLTGEDGQPRAHTSLKLDPRAIPNLPQPRPMFEIWVYSPQVEGSHLRFGKVARGGLRWSDRREDFRTEVLGLVKAQMVKNAVIVPTGSKGAFFPKQLPDPSVDRDAWLEEGRSAYTTFISGLLDVTDNLVGGEVDPADVVRHDEDDTYLVVAADKGTATFSDLANSISARYGFWLDDAFASGGSAGYDHKAMGITARGAWESVKRHFREMGIDTQTQDFTVVGIGDMGGDVFGNGMLLSEHIRLVAAFNHMHVFVDPSPDAARSFVERKRLFETPRTTWADYDPSLISEGGGVWPRSAKSIPLTPQMREALGIEGEVESMTPNELIHAALLAPVDLLWNGGIGTYIKARSESSADIGDRANDAIRVDGEQLRLKVVGEGGNLGASQLGRIEAARHGVRINTDAIDNSAGVASSDREVNIKIALTDLVRSGQWTIEHRNEVLESMTDEVAAAVLRDNYEQNVLLGNARHREHMMLPVHRRFTRYMEREGGLDRDIEFLPSDAEMERRHAEGHGLTSPEFSVLVAYAKLAVKHALEGSDLPDEPFFERTLVEYFPTRMQEEVVEQITAHPLRRQIIVNAIANSMINRGGITFAFRAWEETGASVPEIARAFVIAREIFDLRSYVEAVEELDNVVSTDTQTDLYLEFRRLIDRAVRWVITNRPHGGDISSEIARYREVIASQAPRLGGMLLGDERARLEQRRQGLVEAGVPEALATRAAGLLDSFSLLDIADIVAETGTDAGEVTEVYFATSERFCIDALLIDVAGLSRANRWDSLARGAMRDDLYSVLDQLTRAVLATTKAGAPVSERLDEFVRANASSLERVEGSLADIRALDEAGIAPLSVVLRGLRALVRTGGQQAH